MALDDAIGRLYRNAGIDSTNTDDLIESLLNESRSATTPQNAARVRPLEAPVSPAPQAAPVEDVPLWRPRPQEADAAPAAGRPMFPGKPLDDAAPAPRATGKPMFGGKPLEDAQPTPQATGKPMFPGKPLFDGTPIEEPPPRVNGTPPRVNGTPEHMVPLAPPDPGPAPKFDPWAGEEGDPLAIPATEAPVNPEVTTVPPQDAFPPAQGLEGAPSRGRDTSMVPMPPMDDQPFRSGGSVLDKFGTTTGMLSGKEAYESQYGRPQRDAFLGAPAQEAVPGAITVAEQSLETARVRRDEAKLATDEAVAAARLTGGAGDKLVLKQIAQRTGYGKAQMEFEQAEKELHVAKGAVPTQTGTRDTFERAPGAAVDQITSTARGAARIAILPIEGANELLTGAMGTVRPALDPIQQANQALDAAQKEITDQFAAKLFKKDEAQNERLGSKVVQGVVSTAIFAGTGLAGRAAGLSATWTTAVAGALPQAEGQYQQAQRVEDLTPGYAAEWIRAGSRSGLGEDADPAVAAAQDPR